MYSMIGLPSLSLSTRSKEEMAKSCKGLAMELVKCLSESDCVKVCVIRTQSYRVSKDDIGEGHRTTQPLADGGHRREKLVHGTHSSDWESW
ncbi:hypothetical protein GW17_00037808 [Ensete ventricosum]|nr:hypothetical protein GW17_00037808 [Ensete ventricosum]